MILLHQFDPIALALGPVKIHWYGIMYALGFGGAWWLGRQRVRAGRLPGVTEHAYGDLLFYCMLGVVLGGRIGYMLFYGLQGVLQDPLMILRIWEGGMSFHGGLLGVVAAMAWWARKHRLAFFDVSDFIAPLVPLGLGLGRLGNYVNGELWGKRTDAGWGVVFPSDPDVAALHLDAASLKAQFAQGALDLYARHPSQLYQMFHEGVVLFALVWWFSSRPRPRYAVSGLFALIYGLGRFLIEFVRVPDAQMGDHGYIAFGWLTMGQLLSLPLIIVGLFWLWQSRRMPTLQPAPQAA